MIGPLVAIFGLGIILILWAAFPLWPDSDEDDPSA